jgi:hypothetical protein
MARPAPRPRHRTRPLSRAEGTFAGPAPDRGFPPALAWDDRLPRTGTLPAASGTKIKSPENRSLKRFSGLEKWWARHGQQRSTSPCTRSLRWNGLEQHRRILGRLRCRVERYCGKSGDEHHLEVGIELGGAPRQLDPVHLRHHDIAEQQRERLLAQPLVGRAAIVERDHVVAGLSSAPGLGTGACRYRLRRAESSLPFRASPVQPGMRRTHRSHTPGWISQFYLATLR